MDWIKPNWGVLVTLVGLIGWAFTLKADVDSLKQSIGEPGSLPVIQLKIEQLSDRAKKLEQILEKQEDQRDKMLDVIRSGQEKIDSLIDLLMERQETARPQPRIKPSFPPKHSVPPTSSLWRDLMWS